MPLDAASRLPKLNVHPLLIASSASAVAIFSAANLRHPLRQHLDERPQRHVHVRPDDVQRRQLDGRVQREHQLKRVGRIEGDRIVLPRVRRRCGEHQQPAAAAVAHQLRERKVRERRTAAHDADDAADAQHFRHRAAHDALLRTLGVRLFD